MSSSASLRDAAMRTCLLAIAFLSVVQFARAQQYVADNLVITSKDAYLMQAPELVASAEVRQTEWSSNGRYVAVVRMAQLKPTTILARAAMSERPGTLGLGDTEIVVFDTETKRSTVVFSQPPLKAQIDSLAWLPKAAVVLATANGRDDDGNMVTQLIYVDARSGTSRIIFSQPEPFYLEISPTQPSAVVSQNVAKTEPGTHMTGVVRLLSADGHMSQPVVLPDGPRTVWTTDGRWATMSPVRTPNAKRVTFKTLVIDFVALRTFEVPGLEEYQAVDRKEPIQVQEFAPPVLLGITQAVAHSVVLGPTEPTTGSETLSAVVSTDASSPSLAPKLDGVLYVCRGNAYYRPIIKLPLSTGLAIMSMTQREAALNGSKQCVLASLMYAMDYDEVLPGPERIQDKLMPYIKNSQLLDNFVYTFGGGNLNDLKNPAGTEIGYVTGPGGRAVAYADGHVRWVPDTP